MLALRSRPYEINSDSLDIEKKKTPIIDKKMSEKKIHLTNIKYFFFIVKCFYLRGSQTNEPV